MSNTFWTDEDMLAFANKHCPQNVYDYHLAKYGASKERAAPLFTTLDGVDIHKDDEIIIMAGDMSQIFHQKAKADESSKKIFSNCLIFSTQEAAEKYQVGNKPCLSVKEVRECMPRYLSTGEVKSILDKASDIVKSKLNG